MLSSRPSTNATALRSTFLPLPFHHVHASLSAPAFVPPAQREGDIPRFLVSNERCLFPPRTLIDHVPTPNRRGNVPPYPFHKSCPSRKKEREKERKLVSVPGTVSQPRVSFFNTALLFPASNDAPAPLLNSLSRSNWRPRLENGSGRRRVARRISRGRKKPRAINRDARYLLSRYRSFCLGLSTME